MSKAKAVVSGDNTLKKKGVDKRLANLKPPFEKGKSANPKGRPPGSKNKLSESFISALAHSFEIHGEAAIERVIEESPVDFLKLVAGLVPKDYGVQVSGSDAFLLCLQHISDGGKVSEH